MAITLVNTATAQSITGTLTIPIPTGTQAGDLLLTGVASVTAVAALGVMDGWTRVEQAGPWSSRWLHAFWRIAVDSEPSSESFALGSGSIVGTAAYRGVNRSNPVADSSQLTDDLVDSVSAVIPSVTATRPGRLVGFVGGYNDVTWTPPAGMTERWDIVRAGGPETLGIAMADQSISAGATGTRTFTASAAIKRGGILVALYPSSWATGFVAQF